MQLWTRKSHCWHIIYCHRVLKTGDSSTAISRFSTTREVHSLYSWLGKYFEPKLFFLKNSLPKESFEIGFIELSPMVLVGHGFEIWLSQNGQNCKSRFSWILEFFKKKTILKLSQLLKFLSKFQFWKCYKFFIDSMAEYINFMSLLVFRTLWYCTNIKHTIPWQQSASQSVQKDKFQDLPI